MMRYLSVAALLLAGCSPARAPDAVKADGLSYFQSDIAPLLRTRCATCHLTGQEAGRLALTPQSATANTVNVRSIEVPGLMRVAPGKPDASYLVMKLEGTHIEHGGNGAQMPFGAPPLSPQDIARIRKWIAQGARS